MLDVLIVGAGPAGSVAATVLARAGARVRIVDRSLFPRDKLCGDTVNPGTLGLLRRLNMAAAIDGCGLPVVGMRVTGARGVVIEGRYPDGVSGRALLRRHLDWMLLQDALAAGAQFEPACTVRGAIMDGSRVAGARVSGRPFDGEVRARVTIAADGRRSTLAFGAGHGATSRAAAAMGDGRIRREHRRGRTASRPRRNARARWPLHRHRARARRPDERVRREAVAARRSGDSATRRRAVLAELARDPLLRDRFAGARLTGTPVVLGPLAVDVDDSVHVDGLLLAGDAAGFIDPMTGDGLRFAVRGGELAGVAALDVLEHGWQGVHERLAARRRAEFASKWRFNRLLRSLVTSPAAVGGASWGARLAPAGLRAAIEYAGDVGYA